MLPSNPLRSKSPFSVAASQPAVAVRLREPHQVARKFSLTALSLKGCRNALLDSKQMVAVRVPYKVARATAVSATKTFWLHALRETGSDWLCGKVRQVSLGAKAFRAFDLKQHRSFAPNPQANFASQPLGFSQKVNMPDIWRDCHLTPKT